MSNQELFVLSIKCDSLCWVVLLPVVVIHFPRDLISSTFSILYCLELFLFHPAGFAQGYTVVGSLKNAIGLCKCRATSLFTV